MLNQECKICYADKLGFNGDGKLIRLLDDINNLPFLLEFGNFAQILVALPEVLKRLSKDSHQGLPESLTITDFAALPLENIRASLHLGVKAGGCLAIADFTLINDTTDVEVLSIKPLSKLPPLALSIITPMLKPVMRMFTPALNSQLMNVIITGKKLTPEGMEFYGEKK